MTEYNWKLTAWKCLKQVAIGGITAAIAFLTQLPAEQQVPALVLGIAVLNGVLNFLKHYPLRG